MIIILMPLNKCLWNFVRALTYVNKLLTNWLLPQIVLDLEKIMILQLDFFFLTINIIRNKKLENNYITLF